MKRLLLGITLVVISTSFVNCEKENESVSGEPEVLFQVSYTNYAWGKVQEGFIVDKEGKIHTYKNPQQWIGVEPGKSLSAEQIRQNLEQTQLSGKTIPLDVIQANAEKRQRVDTDQYSKRVNKGNDSGSTVYYLYRYDPVEKSYSSVLLKETGDWETQNMDTEAKEIVTWLTTVNESLKK